LALPDTFTEDAARRVLLLRAYEADTAADTAATPGTGGQDSPLWTADDRAWATRLASEGGAASASAAPAAWLDARARHALQRLLPRAPEAARALAQRHWRRHWLLLAAVLGAAAGFVVDALGGHQRIDLLSVPVWGLVGWNGLVYLGLLLAPLWRLRGGSAQAAGQAAEPGLARRLWQAVVQGRNASAVPPVRRFQQQWAQVSAPVGAARLAQLLHLSAAALALGLVAGLYARGLVLDYRAAWQSTFLEPAQVHALLQLLLTPAAAATALPLPDAAAVAALRVGPGEAATGAAAVWIHLLAASLALFVVLPRLVLAGAAAWRARRAGSRLVLPLQEAYFQRLLSARRREGRGPAVVQVLPHAAALGAQAALALRAVLAAALGDKLQLQLSPAVAYGAEEDAAAQRPAPGTTLRLVLVDLNATPEAETHGRLLQPLQAQGPAGEGLPLLLLADESAFARRFGELPQRLEQRRSAWQALARAQQVPLVCVNLEQPDLPAASAALQTALHGAADLPEEGAA
jgi:hypothetical protein